MKRQKKSTKKKSIFQAIFVPLIIVMFFQGAIFYTTAVFGGIVDFMNQNASDILTERMINRKNELETSFINEWLDFGNCDLILNALYAEYQEVYGSTPFADSKETQIAYLGDTLETLISTLRDSRASGIYLILNDKTSQSSFPEGGEEKKYGLCIRDMDPSSTYTGTEDLLLERAPSSIIEQTGCSLDSWWEARYLFTSEEEGNFFYKPLNAAWENPGAKSEDIAYIEGAHRISESDQEVISYSIPLMDENGRPYAVLGVELTTKYLSSFLISKELGVADNGCYILGMKNVNETGCVPSVTNGSLYERCFSTGDIISIENEAPNGGFWITGRGNTTLYGSIATVNVYNNNNPFEEDQLVLIALEEKNALFYYSSQLKRKLLSVCVISLLLGVICIYIVSRNFAAPITALARRARDVEPKLNFHLGHLGIDEIDQLVDSIEILNQNVSKEIARTEFFSRMSHDMRTPMNAIIGFSSKEMLEGADEAEKDDYLQKIHTSGEYLLGLINEVLDMTKIESNKVDLHYDVLPATGLWDTVNPIIDKLAQKKNVIFKKDIVVPEQVYLKVDLQHLNQIVLNLLSNAVKFTPEGGTVSLKIRMQEVQNQVKCHIRVKDTGIGMSDEFKKKLYRPFEQENEGNGGTGLGLSISKKLVEMMDGTITCSSQKNVGTIFDVELSFEKAEKTRQRITDVEKKETHSMDVLEGRRILLCEDHPLNAQIAVKLLEKKGILVEMVEDGKLGLEQFKKSEEGTYDAILMDIRMPVMNGLEATQAIRALKRRDAGVIPIIAMTANAFEEDIKISKDAGMNAHLSKPIEPKKLYETLESLLAKERRSES